MRNIWFLIPARGGSKGIPKKNIRLLNGKPLIHYVLDTVGKISSAENIIVSTDDEEIESIVDEKATIHHRSKNTANDIATLDDVALEVSDYLVAKKNASNEDLLITIQPTSPFLTSHTVKQAVKKLENSRCETVLSVVDDRHLRWTLNENNPKPLYDERVNRQQMAPTYAETGGIIGTTFDALQKNTSRIGNNIELIEVGEREGLDIDTYEDWARAEFWCNRLRVFIRVDGSKELGFGHLYRALALAQNLTAHEVFFVTKNTGEFRIGNRFLSKHHFPLLEIKNNEELYNLIDVYQPDIVINDILDTDELYMSNLKGKDLFVVNFEDLGTGNKFADIVINDLYPDLYPQDNHWYGIENAILNPNFEVETPKQKPVDGVNHILIAYGGTDPNNLTLKAIEGLKQINYSKKITVILGPGNIHSDQIQQAIQDYEADLNVLHNVKNMAKLMKQADLALTSAGRTVTELMCLGIPTIAICQNMREMRHNHASSSYGVVNLGLGTSINPKVLSDHIKIYIEDLTMRQDMYQRMISATRTRSNAAIVEKIIDTYKRGVSK